MIRKVDRCFYARPAPQVAQSLLGTVLSRACAGSTMRGRIVEVEAYSGSDDPGSHAFRGSTPRTHVMFGPPGHLYVYFTYGMHHCMNVVTDQDGVAGAVLIRALQPLEGIEQMQTFRGKRSLLELCNGPAKLCQALAIDRSHNGLDLLGPTLWIEEDGTVQGAVAVSTRVGLSAGRDLPLRFFLAGNPFVSQGKPS